MRKLDDGVIKKRGCKYCLDLRKKKETVTKDDGGFYERTAAMCIYDQCPYTVLSKFNTYEQYFKSLGSPHKL